MTAHAQAALWDYDARTLDVEQQRFLELHLAECLECTEALEAVRTARGVMDLARRGTPDVEWSRVDAAVTKVVERALEQQARPAVLRPFVIGAVAVLAVAGAAALARPVVAHFTREQKVAPAAPLVAEVVQAPRIEEARGLTVTRGGAALAVSRSARSAGGPRPALTLAAGDVLATSAKGSALVRLPDASRVRVTPGSEVTLAAAERSDVVLDLSRGRVAVHASHVERRRFLVRASGLEVVVVGTVFSVEQKARGVEVAVLQGQVRVETADRALPVGAGERVLVDVKKGRAKALKLPKALQTELAEVAVVTDPIVGATVAATGGVSAPPLVGAAPSQREEAASAVARVAAAGGDRPIVVPLVTAPVGEPRDARGATGQPAARQPSSVPPAAPRDGRVSAAPKPGPLPRLSKKESAARIGQVPETVEPVAAPAAPAAASVVGTPPPAANGPTLFRERDDVFPSFAGGGTYGVPSRPGVDEEFEPMPQAQPQPDAEDDAEGEWNAMPEQPRPVAAPAPAVEPAPVDAAPKEGKTLETIFLERAAGSVNQGTCGRYLAGLEEIAQDAQHTPSTEDARILRARCLDLQLLPRQAMSEYRKYLMEYPQGRFVAEARGALGE